MFNYCIFYYAYAFLFQHTRYCYLLPASISQNVSSYKDQKNDNILEKKRSHAGSALTFKLVARWKLDKSPSLKVGPSIEKLSIQSILKSNVIRHVL